MAKSVCEVAKELRGKVNNYRGKATNMQINFFIFAILVIKNIIDEFLLFLVGLQPQHIGKFQFYDNKLLQEINKCIQNKVRHLICIFYIIMV